MPEYRIEAREKFEDRTIYFVTAKTRAQAKRLVRTGKVAYESHEVLEGRPGEEFIEFLGVTPVTEEPGPEPASPPSEMKQYTVLLLVPPDIQRKAGDLDTFLGHVSGLTIPAAITQAKELAACELDCDDLAQHFTPLLLLEGWHDELLFPKE
jgi:hypothetical protein